MNLLIDKCLYKLLVNLIIIEKNKDFLWFNGMKKLINFVNSIMIIRKIKIKFHMIILMID